MKIINANIFSPESQFRLGQVEFDDGVIQAIHYLNSTSKESGADIIDLSGQYLVPGFIELQINGGFGKDFTASPESIWEIASKMPQFGVTSFLPTIITSPLDTVAKAQTIVVQDPDNEFCGASPLGLHIEGPFLNPAKKGTHSEALIRNPSLEDIQNWTLDQGVKLVTLAPEQSNALRVIVLVHREMEKGQPCYSSLTEAKTMNKKRKNYSPEEKVSILKEHLVNGVPVSELCDRRQLHPTVFYRWQRQLFEQGAAAFQSDQKR
ncbi:MAG: transposase, partial [Anaerolineaceae bacterium]|nr:transposase [Anaerolineaceae bacterium]